MPATHQSTGQQAGTAPGSRVLRAQLRALLWQMMAAVVSRPDPKPLTLSIQDRAVQITATIAPAGATATGGAAYPGKHLGTLETAIWLALVKPMNAKRLARELNEPCSPKIRTILANLVERGVLTHSTEQGYSRATTSIP